LGRKGREWQRISEGKNILEHVLPNLGYVLHYFPNLLFLTSLLNYVVK